MKKCKKCGQEIRGKWSLPLCPDCYMEEIVEEWNKLKEAEMREIKFRAWDKKNKKMLYPGNEWYDICCGAVEGVLAIPHSSVYDGVENKSKEWIPMQYTGHKDRNGREIYDSDIVEWRVGNTSGTGIVEWSDKEASWIIRIKEPKGRLDYWFLSGIDEIEVIGNIYEGVKKKTKRYA